MDLETILLLLTIGFIPCMIIITIALTSKFLGTKSKPSDTDEVDDTRLIQEMYHGFIKMEERVEALETLLLEQSTLKKFEDELNK